jgi:5-oxoprolinase (ATP-hydrolysing)
VSWEFWIDRGGTFTDCIGLAPDGRLHAAKLLSSDAAPLAGIRRILARAGAPAGDPLPPCTVKLGTTVATNALLERRGARTLLVANRGLGDLLRIGTQARPDLFELDIRKPPPLEERVIEVGARVGARGERVGELDEPALRAALAEARADGLAAVAVVLAHGYAYPEDEQRIAALAAEAGFPHVVASHAVAREQGLLARGETTVADAYLTPLLSAHAAKLSVALPGSRLRFMQSSGGLTDTARFRGPTALLSGPAGGVVGAARVAREAGFASAIGFDMGGTSTDVSLVVDGEVDRTFESEVAGVRVKAPMMRIFTVAAGGGSLCRFDGFRLTVGPESAGADPGPLCYGLRDAAGRPKARELALTDVNLLLGRIQPDRFPLPLDPAPARAALAALETALRSAGQPLPAERIAAGFVEVANAAMVQAIAQVSVARGVDPRGHALVGFGGAAGQHVCAIARALGIGTVLLHPLAGLLSAWGIGSADATWDGQRDAGRRPLGRELPEAVRAALAALEAEGRAALRAEGAAPDAIECRRRLDLRYAGTESALSIAEPADGDWLAAFVRAHRERFGYERPGRAVEIATARVQARAPSPGAGVEGAVSAAAGGRRALPLRTVPVWFPGAGRLPAPVFARDALGPGARLEGPALVLEDTSTVVIDPGFACEVARDGTLVLRDLAAGARTTPVEHDLDRADPIRLEVFGNRFMSIAEQMGAVLRNTAFSTNIKERLDFSCAVFDPDGGLVANAPHIPVHLGAMGETVRAVRARFPDLGPEDVVASNDPYEGGSHLPDVTVVSPVFVSGGSGVPDFFVASRGHQADIGGKTPGSMPPDSRTLEEEGVVLSAFRLVHGGRLDEKRVRRLLSEARYPARSPDDNLADFEAMVAANRAGSALLRAMVAAEGRAAVATTMRQLQAAAGAKVAREIERLGDGERVFEDRLDDGTRIRARLVVRGERMLIDFAGTGAAVPGNLNAPRAVVQAAVIYVLRCLVREPIPLNGGCLLPVEVRVPPGSLLDPPPGHAVVGGNVETSQRVVDVLLGALGLVAASQGTMNNVTFGDERFGYYETIGGGAGAGPGFDGSSGVHTHMTNTRITDPEVLEARHPVRIETFALRRGSGGAGRQRGGDGLVRRYRFLAPVTASLLSERRTLAPWGLAGGAPGRPGENRVERADGRAERLGGKASVALGPGDCLVVETPGGGGYGAPSASGSAPSPTLARSARAS